MQQKYKKKVSHLSLGYTHVYLHEWVQKQIPQPPSGLQMTVAFGKSLNLRHPAEQVWVAAHRSHELKFVVLSHYGLGKFMI